MLAIAAVHVGLVSLVIVSSRSVGQALPLRTTLAAFKAPKRVLLVATIGRAANGKLDYKRLRAEALQQLGFADF